MVGSGVTSAIAILTPPAHVAKMAMEFPSPDPLSGGYYFSFPGVDIVKNPRVLARTVADLNLDKLWKVTPAQAVERLNQHLDIDDGIDKPPAIFRGCRDLADRAGIPAGAPIRQTLDKLESALYPPTPSNTLIVRAKSDDRHLSADLAYGVTYAYLRIRSEDLDSMDRQNMAVLADQIREQEERLRLAEEKYRMSIRAFMEAFGMEDKPAA